jgi:hypothetical protein
MATRTHLHSAGLLIVLLGSVATLAADPQDSPRFQNLRSNEANVLLAMTACYDRSSTCRRLIDTIEDSTTIAYANTGWCRSSRPSSCLHFLSTAAGHRFLRITLDPALRGDTLIEMFAHELQHAVEIVRAPDVRDMDTLRALYQAIGYPRGSAGNRDEWETNDARHVTDLVSSELKQGRKAFLQARR